MAPLANAIRTTPSSTKGIYKGVLDPAWTIGAVPFGGYLLAVILDAVIQHQSGTNQPDPIHLSAHFLLPSRASEEYEVRIQQHRQGKRFSNITADLYQNGTMNITTHIIVGTLISPFKPAADKSTATIIPPHRSATRIPLVQHPSDSKPNSLPPKITFGKEMRASQDRVLERRYRNKKNKNDHDPNSGFDSGGWYEVVDANPRGPLPLPLLGFFADLGRNTPALLPRGDRPGTSWFPTLVLTLEFKVKLADLPDYMAPNTFGVYSTGRFINQGRHDVHSEVWTSPAAIGQRSRLTKSDDKEWREKMLCVAVANQMALTIPLEVNQRKGTKDSKAKL